MVTKNLGNPVRGQEAFRIHSADGKHPLAGNQPGLEGRYRVLGKKIVVAHHLNVSVIDPQEVQRWSRWSG